MRRAQAVLALALVLGVLSAGAGCSWIFDDSAEAVVLEGSAIPPSAFPKLNQQPATDVYVLTTRAGARWAALVETPETLPIPGLPEPKSSVRLVPLTPGAGPEELIERTDMRISSRVIYLFDQPSGKPPRLTLHTPGDAAADRMFTIPPGIAFIEPDAKDEVFVLWVKASDTLKFLIQRADGSFQRELPLPPGIDPKDTSEARLNLSPDGAWFMMQDGDGRLVAHSTRSALDRDLGVWPHGWVFLPGGTELLFCESDGLRTLPIDGSPPRTLDSAPCEYGLGAAGGAYVYAVGNDLREVTLDGRSAPRVSLTGPVAQVLEVGPLRDGVHQIAYSTDPAELYGDGIGSGWVGGWQFMTRGRRPTWSLDGSRIRWLENAARSGSNGELYSAELDQPGIKLAQNVRQFTEVRPGQVLAISNAPFKGTQNRLILIDENTRTARWVVDSAREYLRIPGTSDLLVKIVVGQTGYDIRRVPIP